MESPWVLRYRKAPKRSEVKSKIFKGLTRNVIRIFNRKILNYDADRSTSYSNDTIFLDIEDGNRNDKPRFGYSPPQTHEIENSSITDIKDSGHDDHDIGYSASYSSGAENSSFTDIKEDNANDNHHIGYSASYSSDTENFILADNREDNGNGNHEAHCRRECSSRKVSLEWAFVVSNFVLELLSAVIDQLSSVRKPQYALIGMVMSLVAMLVCIIELVYKGRKERVQWRWRGRIPWFYYPSPSDMHFGTFTDIVGLACAISQFIVTTINYSFSRHHADNPIKISVWPMIFAFGLLCSKFLENPNRGPPSSR